MSPALAGEFFTTEPPGEPLIILQKSYIIFFKKLWLHWVFIGTDGASLVVVLRLNCPHNVWDVSSPSRDRTHIPCIGRKIRNYWTTREVLCPLDNQGQLPLTDGATLLSCWFLDTGSQSTQWQFSLIVQRPLWWAKVCKPAKPRIMGVGTAESLCGSWETMINGATYASTPSFPSHKQKPDSVKYTYCISQDVTPSLQTVSKLAFQL